MTYFNQLNSRIPIIFLASLVIVNTQVLSDSLSSDPIQLKKHVQVLTTTQKPRNYKNTDILNSIASYIKTEFESFGYQHVTEQCYTVKDSDYRNVIASVGPSDAELIVVGAHYDVCGEAPGADDNASGVAGLLETARIVFQYREKLKNRVEFVAYTLEEPPFFGTRFMGSYVHASSLSDRSTIAKLMICYDMIGYFSDQKKSQDYPLGILKLFFGTKGDFIACVSNLRYAKHAKKLKNAFDTKNEIRSISIVAPSIVHGIDFSDHRNYWGYKMAAILLTNGAFYRNKNYHTIFDTMEKLNYSKMAGVVNGCVFYILQLR